VADAGIGKQAEPGEDDVVVDVRVVGQGVPVAVGQDILGGHRPLLFGDVEYRFLPVGVADNEHPLVVAGLHGVRDPAGFRREGRPVEVHPLESGAAAGEREQPVGLDGPLLAVLGDGEPDAAVGRIDPPFVGVREHGHVEVLAVVGQQRVAEGWVGLVQRTGVVLDDCQLHARLAEVGDQFHPDVAKPHYDAGIGQVGRIQHVRAGCHVDVVDAGEVGNVRDRARRDDDVVRLEGPVADCQPVVVDKAGPLPEEVDVLAVGEPVDRSPAVGREVGGVLVLSLDDPLKVDLGEWARQPVVVAGREPVFGRREHLFGGHTPPEDAEPAAGVAVVDQRQPDAGLVGKPLGDRDARAPVCAHDRDVRAHARTPPSTRVPGALQTRLIAPPRGTRLRPRGRWSSGPR
jgi:hypothetical protein